MLSDGWKHIWKSFTAIENSRKPYVTLYVFCAVDLAPLGTRASAGTEMIQVLVPFIHMRPTGLFLEVTIFLMIICQPFWMMPSDLWNYINIFNDIQRNYEEDIWFNETSALTSAPLVMTKFAHWCICRKISNIRHTRSPNLDVSRLVVQLSSPNPMKPGIKSWIKM